jgi:phosphatidylinositol alpha-1,6-mannosyltransferase
LDNCEAKHTEETSSIMRSYINIITHEFPPYRGGAGIYCYELALAVSNLGGKVKIWAPNGSEEKDAIEIQKLSWKGSHGLIASWKLVKKIQNSLKESSCKDVFHLAELGSSRAFLRFGWRIKKKLRLFLTIHGSELIRFTGNPIEKWLFKKLILKCEVIHVLSQHNRRKLLEFCPTVENKIRLIPGAPGSHVISTSPLLKDSAIKNKIQILCVGRIHPRKGQDQILLALNTLPFEEQKNLVVRFAGPKTKTKFFGNLLQISKKFAGEIIFHGDCTDNEVRELYNSSDLFALTSMPKAKSVEGFGFVYLEASSYGLPIIANRTGGVEDAVIDGKTGLLAKPGDIKGLSIILRKLVINDKVRERIGKEGKRWAKNFTWDKVARGLYNLD